jgi:hypothetical protein
MLQLPCEPDLLAWHPVKCGYFQNKATKQATKNGFSGPMTKKHLVFRSGWMAKLADAQDLKSFQAC